MSLIVRIVHNYTNNTPTQSTPHTENYPSMKEVAVKLAILLGLDSNNTGHLEKWVSTAGGLVGILSVVMISRQFVGAEDAAWVVASMGATAVLLFAVPHGADIIGSYIKRAMRWPGGMSNGSMLLRPPASFGRRLTRNARHRPKRPILPALFKKASDSKSFSICSAGQDKQNSA